MFLAVLFAAAAGQLFSQTNDGYFYRSDFRIGITAGANLNLQRSVFMWPDTNCKLTEVKGSYKDKTGMAFGIYLGHEHDISDGGHLRLGIDGSIGMAMDGWSIDLENDTNAAITSLKSDMTSIYISEGVYLAYLLTEKIELTGGIEFYEGMVLPESLEVSTVDKNGKSVDSPLIAESFGYLINEAKNHKKEDPKSGFKVSARLRLGAIYNISNLLFVSANLHYTVPVYYTLTASNFAIEGDPEATEHQGFVGKYRNYIQNVGIMLTFGFKL